MVKHVEKLVYFAKKKLVIKANEMFQKGLMLTLR